jgi:hypothetical protein
LLEKGATIVIATPERISAVSFAVQLEPYVTLSVLETVVNEDHRIDIRIFVLSA